MAVRALLAAGLVQGIGSGFLVVPLSMVIFVTLPHALRNEGAAMFALTRNIGSSVSISLIQAGSVRITERVHSRLVEAIRPDSPVLQWRLPDADFGFAPALARLAGQATREAMMVAYLDMFRMVALLAFLMLPLILLLRSSSRGATALPATAME